MKASLYRNFFNLDTLSLLEYEFTWVEDGSWKKDTAGVEKAVISFPKFGTNLQKVVTQASSLLGTGIVKNICVTKMAEGQFQNTHSLVLAPSEARILFTLGSFKGAHLRLGPKKLFVDPGDLLMLQGGAASQQINYSVSKLKEGTRWEIVLGK